MSPACRFGSDLTNTIRARGHRGLHQEAGHTTVPDHKWRAGGESGAGIPGDPQVVGGPLARIMDPDPAPNAGNSSQRKVLQSPCSKG